MATDWGSAVLRWCLYVDLMLVFGLPLFALQFLRGGALQAALSQSLQRIAGIAAVAGLFFSIAGMLFMCLQMSGAESWSELDVSGVQMMASQTDFGQMWQLRMVALALASVCWCMFGRRPASTARTAATCLSGAVALATLAWAGHGAMDEGTRRYQHLVADIAHLLAAGVWIGALVALLLAGRRAAVAGAPGEVALFARCLAGFAYTGTAIVAVLAISGVLNYLMTVGATWDGLMASPYGRMLALKGLLFLSMLGLASLNRWRLVPALESAATGAATSHAVKRVSFSVLTETMFALALLASVAWLGMQSPSLHG